MKNTHIYEHNYFIKALHKISKNLLPFGQAEFEIVNFADKIFDFADETSTKTYWKQFKSWAEEEIKCLKKSEPNVMAKNTTILAEYLELDEKETEFLYYTALFNNCDQFRELFNVLNEYMRLTMPEVCAYVSNLTPSRIDKILDPNGKLMNSGVVYESSNNRGMIFTHEKIDKAISGRLRTIEQMLKKLCTPIESSSVTWDDFDHIDTHREFVEKLLIGALDKKEKGINILFYGPPGSGKTEFCKMIAGKVGAKIYSAGEENARGTTGEDISASERLAQLKSNQRLLNTGDKNIVLFDEMEDSITQAFGAYKEKAKGSKILVNRIFENNPVPTLWTTNEIHGYDAAVLRRFTFVVEMKVPPISARQTIWKKLAKKYKIKLTEKDCDKLARNMNDTPAFADTSLKVAKLIKGGVSDVTLVSAELAKAVRYGYEKPIRNQDPHEFNPELVNADYSLSKIIECYMNTENLADTGGLCLNGPPGTGKSAFARYLANKMNLPIVEKRSSDLLGMFVGQTEKNIAKAFAESREENAFLIFDEVDSLLGNRSNASRQWEVSQVNEMLTWMEIHPLPFACTTNLQDRLDPATVRRFTMNVTFKPLTSEQRKNCFRIFFGTEPTEQLEKLDLLTPGDFASTAKRIKLLGITDAEQIIVELSKEHDLKPEANKSDIGF